MDTRQQKNKKASSDEWYTPKWIIDTLGPFTLDPCSPKVRPFDTAIRHYCKDDDGLTQPWRGRVWLNPPYSRELLERFVRKMADHNNGIALLQNRQDNILWQEVIFPSAASMIFMRHRVKFICPDGRKSEPFFGSCLVAWGENNDQVLKNCGIEGKYVRLNETVQPRSGRGDMSYEELMESGFPDSRSAMKAAAFQEVVAGMYRQDGDAISDFTEHLQTK